ncbi:MAG: tetratricopeptide repeat protein, partial [Planctomycetales bacterium]|nr:tetratricopeptide repeat protein [Planctomycetales bacterium]
MSIAPWVPYHHRQTRMPTLAEALNHGWQLQQQRRLAEAEQVYRQVLAAAPRSADAWCYLGMALHDQRRFGEAEQAYRQALSLKPQFPIAYNNLGNTLSAAGRFDEAEAACRTAIEQQPTYARAFSNLGAVLLKQRRADEAVEQIRQAVELNPNDPLSRKNLGAALVESNRPTEALPWLEQAAAALGTAEAHKDWATALLRLGRLDEAIERYQAALRIDANYAEAHYALSLIRLLRGDLADGWRQYEWRWRRDGFAKPLTDRPEWDGSPLAGRTLLLVAEQGLGDTLQFVRYATRFKQQGARVLLWGPRVLMPLLESCPGLDELHASEQPPPRSDFYLPLMSAPRVFDTRLDSIPAEIPYLQADENLVAAWRVTLDREVPRSAGRRIGIAWQGSRTNQADAQRSVPLAEFAPLAALPDVQLVSLQKGFGREQIADVASHWRLLDLADRLDEATGPFLDTAAVMKHLDLVVCCDTSIAHVA